MKIIDQNLLDNLTDEASKNERLRKNYNLHEKLDDPVQRLLNALEPGTDLPIHRHKNTEETYMLVRGGMRVLFYNEKKEITESVMLSSKAGSYGISIPKGQWHTIDNIEKGTVIFEVKQGPYAPLEADDIL
jgi:cupin fold WbuC family metalloprotein